MKLKSKLIKRHLFLFLCVFALGNEVGADTAEQVTAKLRNDWKLTIQVKDTILIAEPVVLHSKLEYLGDKPFRGAIPHPAIGWSFLIIKHAGKQQSLYISHTRGYSGVNSPPPPLLATIVASKYQQEADIPLLFDFKHEKYLFPAPGKYTLQFMVVLFRGESYEDYQDFRVTSNEIVLTVLEPSAQLQPALKLWRGKEQATLMSRSGIYELKKYPQGLKKLKQLIELYPNSPYAIIARQHLTKMGDAELNALFPDDKRLDQQVSYHFLKQTPLTEVITELSRQTGVSLSLHPDMKKRSLSSLETTGSLREAMSRLDSYKALWIRDGDGYKLVPKEE